MRGTRYSHDKPFNKIGGGIFSVMKRLPYIYIYKKEEDDDNENFSVSKKKINKLHALST